MVSQLYLYVMGINLEKHVPPKPPTRPALRVEQEGWSFDRTEKMFLAWIVIGCAASFVIAMLITAFSN